MKAVLAGAFALSALLAAAPAGAGQATTAPALEAGLARARGRCTPPTKWW